MKRLTRIAIIILGIIVVLTIVAGIAVGGGAYYATRKSFPETDGTLTVQGLQEDAAGTIAHSPGSDIVGSGSRL